MDAIPPIGDKDYPSNWIEAPAPTAMGRAPPFSVTFGDMWGQFNRLVILAGSVIGRLCTRIRNGWNRFWKRSDRWLQRLNHIAQIGLLAGAVFSYFHIVLPLFDKETLERDVKTLQAQASRVAIGLAVSDVQTHCTDSPKPPGEVPPLLPNFGGSVRPSQSREDELLEIPIAECLRGKIAGITPTDSFTKEDIARVKCGIEARIPLLIAKRDEAVLRFQRLKESHAKEREAQELLELGREPDTTLPRGYDELIQRLNLWANFEQKKMEIDFPYRNLVIKSIREAGDQAIAGARCP